MLPKTLQEKAVNRAANMIFFSWNSIISPSQGSLIRIAAHKPLTEQTKHMQVHDCAI